MTTWSKAGAAAALLCAASCGGSGSAGANATGSNGLGSRPLAADASYSTLAALADAFSEAGVTCQSLRGGNGASSIGCDVNGDQQTEYTLFEEESSISDNRISALSTNEVVCKLPAHLDSTTQRLTGYNSLYLRGANWMILDSSGLVFRQSLTT